MREDHLLARAGAALPPGIPLGTRGRPECAWPLEPRRSPGTWGTAIEVPGTTTLCLRRRKRPEGSTTAPEHAAPEAAVLRARPQQNQPSTGSAESALYG